jgi:hypothetical protein
MLIGCGCNCDELTPESQPSIPPSVKQSVSQESGISEFSIVKRPCNHCEDEIIPVRYRLTIAYNPTPATGACCSNYTEQTYILHYKPNPPLFFSPLCGWWESDERALFVPTSGPQVGQCIVPFPNALYEFRPRFFFYYITAGVDRLRWVVGMNYQNRRSEWQGPLQDTFPGYGTHPSDVPVPCMSSLTLRRISQATILPCGGGDLPLFVSVEPAV